MGAVVRGVETGRNEIEKNDFIQSLMDHQEKLHVTLGRKREVHPRGERRPLWMNRPLPPRKEHWFIRE